MLENNSKVAASHPDLGYSIWLEFVCLAPSISVYLKFGSLNQPQERHLFLLTKVQWEGKGHSKVAESAYPIQHGKAWCRAHSASQKTWNSCGFCPSKAKQWLQNVNSLVFSETAPSLGPALPTKTIRTQKSSIGFFSWFSGARILVSLFVSYLALRTWMD